MDCFQEIECKPTCNFRENLVLALKPAESDMILEGTSIFDSFMPSAHSTKTTSLDTTSSSMLSTGSCQCCGATFQPKKATHIRCDKCQNEYSSKRKADRKKVKQVTVKKDKQRKPASKPFAKKVHSTTTVHDDEDSYSSDDSEEDNYGAHYTSFCCTHATHSSPVSEPLVYFDNCSNIKVIRDAPLALALRREKTPTKITGSIPGKLHATHSADLGDLGRGVFNPDFSRNLLSEDASVRAGYRIIRDSSTDNTYSINSSRHLGHL